jgi:hypothetical protein
MNFLKPCLAILAAGFAGSALACDYPTLVPLPDADDATMDDMVTTQESVRAYMENMDAYLTCVNEELAAAGDDAPDEFKAIMVSRYNAAVAEMEAIAESWNDERTEFLEENQ